MSNDDEDQLFKRLAALSTDASKDVKTVTQQVTQMQLHGMKQFDETAEPFENYVEQLEAYFSVHNIPQEKHAGTLISCLGSNVFQILRNSLLPQTFSDFTYEQVKSKLIDILNPKSKIIPSRQKFLKRKQNYRESISDYISKLRELIVDCQYPDEMVEEMLRDVFIGGLRSEVIANKLGNKDDISLEMTLDIALSLEEVGCAGDTVAKSSRKKLHNPKKFQRSKTQSDDSKGDRSPNDNCKPVRFRNLRLFENMVTIQSDDSRRDGSSGNICKPVHVGNLSTSVKKIMTIPQHNPLPDLPFSGSRTDRFFVNLPGSETKNECKLTLEWFGNQGSTDRAILNVSSSNEGNTSLKLDLNLSEVICVLNSYDSVCFPTTKNIEEKVSPLTVHYNKADDKGLWLTCISTIWERVHEVSKAPRERSIWGTTELGDIYVSDVESLKKNQSTMNNRYLKEYQIKSPTPFRMSLPNKFPNRTEITINGFVRQNADRFHVNLVCGNDEIALHFNPRFKDRVIVRNSFTGGDWGLEERTGVFNIEEKKDFTLTILCMEDKFKIFLNGIAYTFYNHRLPAEFITDIEIDGQVNVHGILYESDNIILEPKDLLWKKLAKNLRKVETCPARVTWGIDHKGVPTYFRKTADEGERWYVNSYTDDPKLKDLSLSVLDSPTNPENIALWAIDEKGKVLFREGVTIRNVAGKKWTQIETDQLVRSVSCGGIKQVWCCGEKGTCFWRFGITDTNPMGEAWRFVKCQDVGSTFKEVAVGKWTVWVLDDKGELYVRREITPINPGGVFWRKVTNNDKIDNNKFKRIYVSDENVWAVTKKGVLCKRMGISSSNPAGISWSYGLSANWYQISE